MTPGVISNGADPSIGHVVYLRDAAKSHRKKPPAVSKTFICKQPLTDDENEGTRIITIHCLISEEHVKTKTSTEPSQDQAIVLCIHRREATI